MTFRASSISHPGESLHARMNLRLKHIQPRSRGEQGGPGSMSYKQEGLSNTNTSNPYVNEPGLSEKGEGETDSAKVKGTVQHDRPQV